MKSLNVAVLSLLLFAGAAANGRPTAGDPAAPVKTVSRLRCRSNTHRPCNAALETG